MRQNSSIVLLLAVAVGLVPVGGAPAQQVDTSKPIVIKQSEPKTKRAKFTGYVQHMNNVQITVRSKENELALRTFSYSPEIRERIQEVLDLGGFQYGDKVTIEYEKGTDVAVKIKGKMSPAR